jgi:hypothetical protein
MEVIIDGVKYVPQDQNKVIIRDVEYDNVGRWLTNIHGDLLRNWVNKVKEGKPAPALDKEIKEFEYFVEKYLGFISPKDGNGFIELKEV